MNVLSVFVAFALLFEAAAVAQSASPPPDLLTQIAARGRLLEAYDQAAWHGSDAAAAIARNNTTGLDMFIARKTTGGWLVDFGKLDAAGTTFFTAIEASSTDGEHFTAERLTVPRADTGFLVSAARAIKTAEAHFQPVPSRRYNVAVLPNDDGTMYIYLYPAQTNPDIYPLGGDERYKISADGATIVEDHRMHRTILDTSSSPSPNGSQVVAGIHTDIYSDVPEDTDVFHVLARRPAMPDYVVARNHLFVIHPDGTIESKGDAPNFPPGSAHLKALRNDPNR